MEATSSSATAAAAAAASTRYGNLTKSFKLAVRSLLTACSREDVNKAFSSFTDANRESLYHMFIHVIKSLHSNIEEEFDSICQETEIGTALDKVDQFIEEQSLDILSTDKTNIEDVKEKISKAKKDEISYLTSLLEKVEQKNNEMRTRIEFLKKEEDCLATRDVVDKLRHWNAEYENYNAS